GHSCPRKAGRRTKARRIRRIRGPLESLRLNHFAAAQTGSADAHVLGRSAHLRVNRPQIDVPAPFADVVSVTDGISELRPLAADITNSCHNSRILPGLLPKLRFYRNPADFAKPCARTIQVSLRSWDLAL